MFSCLNNKKSKEALNRLNKLDETLNNILIENGYIDLTPDETTESSQTNSSDNNGLSIGAQQTATQAISSADALNMNALPEGGSADMTGGVSILKQTNKYMRLLKDLIAAYKEERELNKARLLIAKMPLYYEALEKFLN